MPSSRYDYVKYNETAAKLQEAFKNRFVALDEDLGALQEGRAKALAITKLEEAYMWLGKAIRDQQIANCGPAELQEKRKDG